MIRTPALILALTALSLLPASGGGAGPVAVVAAHDLHIAYGDLAVEGSVIAGRIRFFQDDLGIALGALLGVTSLGLEPGPEIDGLVMRYVREHFTIEIDGRALEASLVQSGQDELDREPVFWILIQFQAEEPVESFTVTNTLLFESFPDQRNICKFVRFPDQTQRTFYFADGESEHRVTF